MAKGTSITWLSLFTHHQVVRATLDGEEITISREREAGLNAFDTQFIYVPPNERVTLEFDLEGEVDLSNGYELVIMPQPVANPDFVEVNVKPRSGAFTGPDTTDGSVVYLDPMTEPITASAFVGTR